MCVLFFILVADAAAAGCYYWSWCWFFFLLLMLFLFFTQFFYEKKSHRFQNCFVFIFEICVCFCNFFFFTDNSPNERKRMNEFSIQTRESDRKIQPNIQTDLAIVFFYLCTHMWLFFCFKFQHTTISLFCMRVRYLYNLCEQAKR